MAFFAGGFGMPVLGRPAAAPADPAADLHRVLNQYANQILALEKEAEQIKGKQQAAQAVYTEAVQQLAQSKSLLLRAEADVGAQTANIAQATRDAQARAAASSQLTEQVTQRKAEVEDVQRLAEAQQAAFLQEVAGLEAKLRELQQAKPEAFFNA